MLTILCLTCLPIGLVLAVTICDWLTGWDDEDESEDVAE